MPKYATLDDIDEETRYSILTALHENERFLGGITATDAFRASQQTRLILTDQRLLTFSQKNATSPLSEIDRANISHADFEEGILSRTLTIVGTDGLTQEWDLDINGAGEFAEAVLSGGVQRVYDDDFQIESHSHINGVNDSKTTPGFNNGPGGNTERNHGRDREPSATERGRSTQEPVTDSSTDYQHPAIADLSQSELLSELQSMDNYDFEYFVADIWEQMGWETEVSQASVDAGIDVTATKSNPYPEKNIIQAKRYGENTSVGGPDIQQYASLKQQVSGTDSVIVVTTGSFTNAAEKRATDLNVKTVDGDGIVSMVDDLDARNLVTDYIDIPLESSAESEFDSELGSTPMGDHGTDSPDTAAMGHASPAPDHELEAISSDEGDSTILHVADRIVGATNQTTDQESSALETRDQTRTADQTGADDVIANSQSAGNWHYGVIGLSAISILGLFAGVADVAGFSILLLLPITYLDIRDVRTVTTEWQPKTWLYLLGMFFVVFIAAPLYLYRRKTVVGL